MTQNLTPDIRFDWSKFKTPIVTNTFIKEGMENSGSQSVENIYCKSDSDQYFMLNSNEEEDRLTNYKFNVKNHTLGDNLLGKMTNLLRPLPIPKTKLIDCRNNVQSLSVCRGFNNSSCFLPNKN